MDLKRFLVYFVIGGFVTTTIVTLEEIGMPLLSRLAALFPVFTWLPYLFIGQFGSAEQVSSHAKFVLIGSLISWIPYMLSIIYLAPKIGVYRALLISLLLFTVIALIFSFIYLNFQNSLSFLFIYILNNLFSISS